MFCAQNTFLKAIERMPLEAKGGCSLLPKYGTPCVSAWIYRYGEQYVASGRISVFAYA